jgi:O-antigen/teichoic acid export membrane protein
MSSPSGGGLAGRTIRGVFWSYGAFAISKAVLLLATAILARLLVPSEFGIVALATVVVSFLSVLQGLGLGSALIQRRGDIERASNVVFTLNLLLGVSLTVGAFLVAPWVAEYFREPGATPLLRALGLTFTLEALGTVHLVRLQRDLRFERTFIPDAGQAVLKGVVSIGLAVAGMGAWSLIIGQLAGVVAGVLLSWAVFPWRPRLLIDNSLAGKLIAYGLPLFGVEVMWVLSVNLDYVIIGRRLGSESLGIYTLAYRLPELLVLSLMAGVSRVVFPALSAVQNRLEEVRRGFLATTHFVVLVTLPISVGMAIVADPFIRVALGSDWVDAIPVLRVLAIFVMVASLVNADGDVYKAVGRPGILFKLDLMHVGLLVPALLIGVQYGLVGVAVGHLFATITTQTVRTVVISRFLDVPILVIASQWRSAIVGTLVLAVTAGTAMYLTAEAQPLVSLAATVLAGALGYVAVLILLERENITALVRSGLTREEPVADEIDA